MKEILELANQYGFGFVLASFFLYLLGKLSNIGLSYIKKRSDKSFENIEKNLKYHQFFSEMDYHISIRIPSLPIQNKFKKKVFSDILNIKYKIFKDNLYEFVQRKDIDMLDRDELSSELNHLFNDSISKCKEDCKRENIPEMAIDIFMEWHKRTIASTSKTITEFCKSDFFYNNTAKIGAILSAYSIEFNMTIVDAEKTLEEINGHLVGLEYKGLICKKDVYE